MEEEFNCELDGTLIKYPKEDDGSFYNFTLDGVDYKKKSWTEFQEICNSKDWRELDNTERIS